MPVSILRTKYRRWSFVNSVAVYVPRQSGARRSLPTYTQAVAILIPRHYSTETSSSSQQNSNYPPPGFDAQKAKKPLSKEEEFKRAEAAIDVSAEATQQIARDINRTGATGEAKGNAQGGASLTELAATRSAAQKAAANHTDDLNVAEAKKEEKN